MTRVVSEHETAETQLPPVLHLESSVNLLLHQRRRFLSLSFKSLRVLGSKPGWLGRQEETPISDALEKVQCVNNYLNQGQNFLWEERKFSGKAFPLALLKLQCLESLSGVLLLCECCPVLQERQKRKQHPS